MEPKICFLALALTLSLLSMPAASSTAGNYKKYLKTACNSTTYPKICYKSLSSYTSIIKTNELTLCSTALNVSLQAAINTSSIVDIVSKQQGLSHTETQVIEDCVDQIADSIDELKQSLNALYNIMNMSNTNSDLRFEVSNVQTWVSAAITDEDTCLDGFDGVNVRSSVKNKINKVVLNLAMITSNALALINKNIHVY